MAINGRINVDVLFHDTDGTTSLKVVSLESATEYTAGKVAVTTGTCGTTDVTVTITPTTFRDSSGSLVSFASVSRIAFQADNLSKCRRAGEDEFVVSNGNQAAITQVLGAGNFQVSRIGTAGTASYTLVMYGT